MSLGLGHSKNCLRLLWCGSLGCIIIHHINGEEIKIGKGVTDCLKFERCCFGGPRKSDIVGILYEGSSVFDSRKWIFGVSEGIAASQLIKRNSQSGQILGVLVLHCELDGQWIPFREDPQRISRRIVSVKCSRKRVLSSVKGHADIIVVYS